MTPALDLTLTPADDGLVLSNAIGYTNNAHSTSCEAAFTLNAPADGLTAGSVDVWLCMCSVN